MVLVRVSTLIFWLPFEIGLISIYKSAEFAAVVGANDFEFIERYGDLTFAHSEETPDVEHDALDRAAIVQDKTSPGEPAKERDRYPVA